MPRCYADPDGLRFHYVSDEFSYDDFDKAGKLKIWTSLRVLYVIGRWQKQKYAKIFYKANGKTFPVAKYYHTTLHPAYYKHVAINFPCRITTWISHVNQSGYWVDTNFYNRKTGQLLQSSVIYVMIIDRQTRKPVKRATKQDINELIPSSLRRTDFPEVFIPSIAKKSSIFHIYTASVSPSDTDHHQHMGNDGFMKHCLDAAASAASMANKFSSFDLSISNVRDFSAVYSGEAMSGDTLDIECRQNGPTELTFEVRIKSAVVCCCKASFSRRTGKNGENKLLTDLDDNNMKTKRLMSKL